MYNCEIRGEELPLSSVRSDCRHTREEGAQPGQGPAGEEAVVEAEQDGELPVVEVGQVVRGVGDVQAHQDHEDQRHDHRQQVQQEVDEETGEGGGDLVGSDETNTSPHDIEAPGPVSLTIGCFVTVQSYPSSYSLL